MRHLALTGNLFKEGGELVENKKTFLYCAVLYFYDELFMYKF